MPTSSKAALGKSLNLNLEPGISHHTSRGYSTVVFSNSDLALAELGENAMKRAMISTSNIQLTLNLVANTRFRKSVFLNNFEPH